MISKIISGGQTGVDIAALRAAKALGIETGGWMPKGWLTEDGPRPEYVELYGMKEHSSGYAGRTRLNVRDVDATLIYADSAIVRGGTLLALNECLIRLQPRIVLVESETKAYRVASFRHWIEAVGSEVVLNVAGPRESKCPGIEARAEEFLTMLFREIV